MCTTRLKKLVRVLRFQILRVEMYYKGFIYRCKNPRFLKIPIGAKITQWTGNGHKWLIHTRAFLSPGNPPYLWENPPTYRHTVGPFYPNTPKNLPPTILTPKDRVRNPHLFIFTTSFFYSICCMIFIRNLWILNFS